jgi:uncharacterized protein YaiL (DUF2058 family)
MSLSLREQLLQAGLVTEKQVKQVEQKNRAAPPLSRKQRDQPTERERAAQKAQAEKAARDQELNRKKQQKAEQNARWAQVRQLIEQHRVARPETNDEFEYYNFVDRAAIKRIAITPAQREQINRSSMVIVRCGRNYDLVPADAAERIRERVPAAVMSLNANLSDGNQSAPAADDPYANYVVPDDLIW